MNAERGFELHRGAASDITSIWEFIAKDSPVAAKRVREDILDTIRKLVPFPNQGHQRRDLTSRPVRFQTVRNYLIGFSASSPKASRSFLTAVFNPSSKSTNVSSGQRRFCSSSRVTARPGFSASTPRRRSGRS
jgi:plasmid stabilization system protein ParE